MVTLMCGTYIYGQLQNLNVISQAIFSILYSKITLIQYNSFIHGSFRSPQNMAHLENKLQPHTKFELNLTYHF